jgi:hypothetical protein
MSFEDIVPFYGYNNSKWQVCSWVLGCQLQMVVITIVVQKMENIAD